MKRTKLAMILTVTALLVSSAAFAYGPGHGGKGDFGMGWMAMDCGESCDGDCSPGMGRPDRNGRGQNQKLTNEERTRMDAFRQARLELQMALTERPVDGEKVARLQDKIHGLRWDASSMPETIRQKMAELRRSALELKLALAEKPVDANKATTLHDKMIELRGEIARWRLGEEIKGKTN